MKKSDLFWQSYLNLERSFIELSEYIFITDSYISKKDGSYIEQPRPQQLETFSPRIADLLVQYCVQIEAISKELYYEIEGSTKHRGDETILFDTDCLKEIDKIWNTHDKTVIVTAFNLSNSDNKILKPLHNAHKQGKPYWKKAYQAVKHDRYNCLSMGNVKALLHALSALYLLNLYYRKDRWIMSYQDIGKLDMSCGSKIFAVNPPKTNKDDGTALWDTGNIPIVGDSPYIITYTNSTYERITNLRKQGNKALDDFIKAQPEMNNQDFISHILNVVEDAKCTRTPFHWVSELMKFRLHKRIPSTISFEERRELLVNSREWKGQTYSSNQHLQPDEITVDNIEAAIDKVGYLAGIDIELDLSYINWLRVALIDAPCEVRIPTMIEINNINANKVNS